MFKKTNELQTLRGVGREVRYIIAEELGVLPVGLIYNIVLPTMILAHTVFIGISSKPVDEDSPMYRLIAKRYPETGKRVIKSCIFTTICASCRRRGMRNCQHDTEDHWSSKEQSRKVELLMSDRRKDYEREMRNEESTDKLVSAAFNKADIDALDQTSNDFCDYVEIDYIYAAIDPAAGGERSKAAIMTIAVINGFLVVRTFTRYSLTSTSIGSDGWGEGGSISSEESLWSYWIDGFASRVVLCGDSG